MNKFYVVGSGIVGCVVARELAKKNHKVEIWEKRNHVGGNLYDYTDDYGVHVHKYGPHIFHTNDDIVWKYVNEYCEFEKYNLVCGSVMDGKCVPTSFDFQSVDTFFPNEAEIIKAHIKATFGDKDKATVLEMLDCDDEYVKKFAQFLYDKDYAPYTAKQWGIQPEEVDRDIFKRVPVLFSYGSKYFSDKYQAMPRKGYMELIDNLLSHPNIIIQTNYDALEHLTIKNNQLFKDNKLIDGKVIYTGPIDELFGCIYGKLPYRSLRFEWKHDEIDSFQDMPVVAYPQAEGFTRITEYKKLPNQEVEGTTYAVEYPLPYKRGEKNEPYYPVVTEESKKLYEKYRNRADSINGLVCCGRLADFKYYNMDQGIAKALEIAESL
ncbi:MAG: UDP-galactopyranose mutase [Pseudobutyrivibrio ruminis]|uniref:UDP-galactopyranose mutase n=1 Tax=Pseudobutyrivibrio ruminis TaxID=46206 RepID=UPI0026F2022D|nr:UDP-galactopyranose mutase [Pseudobutyrivibrio ruminis]MBE5912907.1 UDP-galactopyranose mutase [Pseudobutyrivibrio ruminis]